MALKQQQQKKTPKLSLPSIHYFSKFLLEIFVVSPYIWAFLLLSKDFKWTLLPLALR